jgi:hypothetical protein
MLVRLKKGRGKLRIRTRYHPVALPVSPSLLWEVRTKRTLGAIAIIFIVEVRRAG